MSDLYTRSADTKIGSYDPENHTIEVVWTTGARVLRRPFMGSPYYEELDLSGAQLDALNRTGVFLSGHHAHSRSVLGRVVPGTARIEGEEGLATIKLSRAASKADEIQEIIDGIVPGISVGYSVRKWAQVGELDGVPVKRAVDWTPREISSVAIGADAGASTRSFSMEDETTPVEAPKAPQVDPAEVERERAAGILASGRALGLDLDTIQAVLTEGADLARSREKLIAKRAELDARTATAPPVEVGDSEGDVTLRAVEGYLRNVEAGVALDSGVAPEPNPYEAEAARFRGASLMDVARAMLTAGGVDVTGRSPSEIAQLALRGAGPLGTSDFPKLLGDSLNRSLKRGFNEAPSTYKLIALERPRKDFHNAAELDVSSFPELQEVAEGAEITVGSFEEAGETWHIGTYGRIVAFTFQTLVNDDLGAFSQAAWRIGYGVRTFKNALVMNLFASNPTMSDGNALFSADHGNLLSSGAAPDKAEYSAMRKKLRKQKDLRGTYLHLRPRLVLGPTSLLTEMESVQAPVTPATPADAVPSSLSKIMIADSPILDDNSATAYYMLADPRIAPVMVYGGLRGEPEFSVLAKDDFSTLTRQWRVVTHFGAGVVGYRGAVKNPGV